MRLNEATQSKVNDTIGNITEMDINVRRVMGKTGVCKGNWCICDLEELAHLVRELQTLQAVIEDEAGIEF